MYQGQATIKTLVLNLYTIETVNIKLLKIKKNIVKRN